MEEEDYNILFLVYKKTLGEKVFLSLRE